MTAAQALAELLTPDPTDLARLLTRLAAEGRGVWIDVGGLRGAWRADGLVIEAYELLPGTEPGDLL